jgi:glyoxylase-like metal-dependent hydrolase (beta-lactamase superfamily II)
VELIKLKDRVYYISNFTNIGVIKGETGLILIDTGIEERTARNILRLLEKEELGVKAILNTHSHADHCGGNKYIKEISRARIIAPEVESSIIEEPLLEPLMFYSGAAPLDTLKNKFLMAQASPVDEKLAKDIRKLEVEGITLGVIPLGGHSINQVGYEIDQVLFCGDAVFPGEVLEKHPLPFFNNIQLQIETLKRLKELDYELYLPSHSKEPLRDIGELVEINLQRIREIEGVILNLLEKALTTEEIIREVFKYFNIKLSTAQHYYLSQTSLLAYLSYLYNQKIIKMDIKNNILGWKRA